MDAVTRKYGDRQHGLCCRKCYPSRPSRYLCSGHDDLSLWGAFEEKTRLHTIFHICFVSISRQRSSKITSKSCDPRLLSEENIAYKNPYSCFYSKITFWWMTSLLWKGFFKPLELNDLGNLPESDTSRCQYDQFLFIYQGRFKVG